MSDRPDRFAVSFVGAGPGDADLLTVRALRAIERADIVLYDSLVGRGVLACAAPTCRLIDVGKRGDGAAFPQSSTNAMMAQFARAGMRVVRLKGGDPSVFGRVEEERRYLEDRGVDTVTIPGVTAASAAGAQFSFSLTARDEARRVLYLTGRASGGAPCLPADETLADPHTTLVLYMACHVISEVQSALLGAGRAPATPVLIVESAGDACARALRGDLADLAALTMQKHGSGPRLVIVGAVAAHARGVRDVSLTRARDVG